MTAVQHSAETDSWGTPADMCDRARRLMGGIELDPASSAAFNRIVQANRFYSAAADGLTKSWKARTVFLNPPGGKRTIRGHSPAAFWWRRLAWGWQHGEVHEAVFVIFNLETLRYAQQYPDVPHPLDKRFRRCWPKERLRFLTPELREGSSPGHPNAIVWLPPVGVLEGKSDPAAFEGAFGDLGLCT